MEKEDQFTFNAFNSTVNDILFSQNRFRIPRYQRPYSWEQEIIDDFWQDTIVAEDNDYFIGSFVFWFDAVFDDLFYVVDGQQRLTTITILFAVIRDILNNLDENTLFCSLR